MKPWMIYLIAIAAMSFITFILYGVDKSKAKRNAWRVPEKTLFIFGFFCGAIGGLLGMNAFRHKTKHWYFWVINILELIIQIAAFIVIYTEL